MQCLAGVRCSDIVEMYTGRHRYHRLLSTLEPFSTRRVRIPRSRLELGIAVGREHLKIPATRGCTSRPPLTEIVTYFARVRPKLYHRRLGTTGFSKVGVFCVHIAKDLPVVSIWQFIPPHPAGQVHMCPPAGSMVQDPLLHGLGSHASAAVPVYAPRRKNGCRQTSSAGCASPSLRFGQREAFPLGKRTPVRERLTFKSPGSWCGFAS